MGVEMFSFSSLCHEEILLWDETHLEEDEPLAEFPASADFKQMLSPGPYFS